MSSFRSAAKDTQIDDVEPVEQIFPKALFLHFFLEVLVGRREDSDVCINRPGTTKPLKLLVLKNP
jgi:hypothetical protein